MQSLNLLLTFFKFTKHHFFMYIIDLFSFVVIFFSSIIFFSSFMIFFSLIVLLLFFVVFPFFFILSHLFLVFLPPNFLYIYSLFFFNIPYSYQLLFSCNFSFPTVEENNFALAKKQSFIR